MKPELDAALCEDFPLLYRDRHAPMSVTCMCWGFQHGDGWYQIIRKLSEKLENAIAVMPDNADRPRAMQVKEKFGGLRFSLVGAVTAEMYDWIDEAEEECGRTCEGCGAPGSLRSNAYIQTLCDNCNRPSVDELVERGAVQVSRKYRRVFVPPEPCVEHLKHTHPDRYDELVEETLRFFETKATSICWHLCQKEFTYELTPEEFDEYREKTTGKKPWSPEVKEQCPDCLSLGHIHRRTCKNFR